MARAVFVTNGLDVPFGKITPRRGRAPTVYRHFPTKEMLAGAAFTSRRSDGENQVSQFWENAGEMSR
ncbi:hypothetical protein [Nocardia wallacei]|uniref:hypothetical protein n=1 Tax=Nocardia wallacei TaxID=480035 RepID=UPI0024579856|nr:hypothetical protein [Nocardia wallacei]